MWKAFIVRCFIFLCFLHSKQFFAKLLTQLQILCTMPSRSTVMGDIRKIAIWKEPQLQTESHYLATAFFVGIFNCSQEYIAQFYSFFVLFGLWKDPFNNINTQWILPTYVPHSINLASLNFSIPHCSHCCCTGIRITKDYFRILNLILHPLLGFRFNFELATFGFFAWLDSVQFTS